MTRRRKPATKERSQKSRWFTVQRWMNCSNGHAVTVGTRARWTTRRDGTATCAMCLAKAGIFEPGQPVGVDE